MRDFATLFDLDGVVFDTESNYTKFWTKQGEKYFPEIKNFSQIIKGRSLSNILESYFNDYKSDWTKIEEDLYEMEKGMTFPYITGVENMLKQIHETGIPICLVTSSDAVKMQTVLKSRPEIGEYFPLRVIGSDIKNAKPAPDCYLLGAKKCDMPANRCIVLEDSLAGIQAGRSAGMKVIGLSTTVGVKELEGKVDRIIPDFGNFSVEDIMEMMKDSDR